MTAKPDAAELYAQLAAANPPKRMGRPPRAVKRVQIALRLEPDMAAAIDAQPGETRHGKIVELIGRGLRELNEGADR